MNRILAPAAAAVLLLAGLASAAPRPSLPAAVAPPKTPRTLPFRPGEVVALLADGDAIAIDGAGRASARAPRLADALARHGLVRAERLGPGTAERPSRLLRLHSERPGFDPVAAARDLTAGGAIAACPNFRIPVAATMPNDSLLASQWYVYQASPRADIHLPEAWDLEKGSASTTIAILDMGVDLGHPDLASRIWTNPGEIPGNGIDDDHNGLVDDVHGWDFGDGDNDPDPQFTPDPDYGVDFGFHGTFCAGIAAAATDNVSGIAGAGWNCRILPIKAAKADSGLSVDAVAAGMEYAAAMHANVLSMSFGAANDTAGEARDLFQALVNDDVAAGVICVAAAGNSGDSSRVYPAACNGVISVGATDESDARAYFSNWGPWVDVAAPGQDMWSTICRNYEIDFFSEFWYEFFYDYDGANPYMLGDGTSFACPLVAGVCGLLKSHTPAITPALAEQILIQSGDTVAYDEPIGKKVNAWRALTQGVLAVPAASPVLAMRLRAEPNPSAGAARLQLALPRSGEVRLAIYDAAGRLVRELERGFRAAGVHEARWDGLDAAGGRAAAGIYFARLEAGGERISAKLVRIER